IHLDIDEPRVGLLSNGEEAGKGDDLRKTVFPLLESLPGFVGNVEGRDFMHDTVDVIVTDGFTGNVALKTLEGAMRFAAGELRTALTSTRAARLGAVLQRRGLRELSHRLEPESYGGAVLLGMGGTVVIAHGASTARAVTAACALAVNLTRGDITERVKERIGVTEARRSPHFLRRDRER
ncbi:MAG: phosphate acyltransferase PlsX, partial [Trebonia sp.]